MVVYTFSKDEQIQMDDYIYGTKERKKLLALVIKSAMYINRLGMYESQFFHTKKPRIFHITLCNQIAIS